MVMIFSGWMRKQYLGTKLQDALNSEREKDTICIRRIFLNDDQKKKWVGIHQEIKQKKNAGVMTVDNPMPGGSIIECKMEKTVEGAIADEILALFERAESAPICQGALLELL